MRLFLFRAVARMGPWSEASQQPIRMKLDDALPLLQSACNRKFRDLFEGHPVDLHTNKGHAGQLLLKFVGLKLDSNLTDFEDGELKTNKAKRDSSPAETMFITQISDQIDSLVSRNPTVFEDSNLFAKIRNLVFLPVVKESPSAAEWYFTRCIRVQVKPGSALFAKLEEDYHAICAGLRHDIEAGHGGSIHTTNGPHYLQVRSKDSKPYHPIFSKVYQRCVSNKNHAFYFRKEFMKDALCGRL